MKMSDLVQTNDEVRAEQKRGRSIAMTFGSIVYVGVVAAATTLFLSFIMLAFPEDAFFSRAVMGLAGILIGGSMIAFPVALHNWAVTGWHRNAAVMLYYGEMAIIALNTIVSFSSMLFKYAGEPLPAWVSWYEPFSVGAIVYTLFAWGTIFLLDPQIRSKAKEHEAMVKFDERVSKKMDEFLDSIEGEDAIAAMASIKIQERFMSGKIGKQHFGSGRANPVDAMASDAKAIQELDPTARGNGKH